MPASASIAAAEANARTGGGASFCEHNRHRSKYKDCGGVGICQHNRISSTCKDCGGASICLHYRPRSRCKDRGGTIIFQHNSKCKDEYHAVALRGSVAPGGEPLAGIHRPRAV